MNYRTQSLKLPETLTGDGEPQPNLILGQGFIHQTFWGDDIRNKQRNYNQRDYSLEAISDHATIMYSQRQPFFPHPLEFFSPHPLNLALSVCTSAVEPEEKQMCHSLDDGIPSRR